MPTKGHKTPLRPSRRATTLREGRMADAVDNAPNNEAPEGEASQDDLVSRDEVSENGASDQPTDSSVVGAGGGASGRRTEEFHRLPTRMERLRVWLEGLP